MRRPLCILLPLLLWSGCTVEQEPPPAPVRQNPSPMVEHTRVHERIASDTTYPGIYLTIEDVLAAPVEVYLPERHRAADSVALLLHLHGASHVPNTAVQEASDAYLAAVVNLGSGSSVYERAFADPAVLSRLIVAVEDALNRETRLSRVVVSAFSAGYGGVRALLRDEASFAALDGVLLLDGLHTDYVPTYTVLAEGGRLEATKLDPFLRVAQAALQEQAYFLITHSEVFPGTFASTTETADYLLDQLGLRRTPVLRWGPGGMQQLSEARRGRFTVLGFAGNTAPDHVDHLHALPAFLDALFD